MASPETEFQRQLESFIDVEYLDILNTLSSRLDPIEYQFRCGALEGLKRIGIYCTKISQDMNTLNKPEQTAEADPYDI